jgi:hypothetical protein
MFAETELHVRRQISLFFSPDTWEPVGMFLLVLDGMEAIKGSKQVGLQRVASSLYVVHHLK